MSAIYALGIVALVGLVFVLPVLALLDAGRQPDWVWEASGESKSMWTTLFWCSFVLFIPVVSLVGVAATPIYLLSRRQKLDAVARRSDSTGARAFVL